MSAEIGGGRDDAPAGEYNNEDVEDTWRPLCKGLETFEGPQFEEFGSMPQLLIEPSSMFSDLYCTKERLGNSGLPPKRFA